MRKKNKKTKKTQSVKNKASDNKHKEICLKTLAIKAQFHPICNGKELCLRIESQLVQTETEMN